MLREIVVGACSNPAPDAEIMAYADGESIWLNPEGPFVLLLREGDLYLRNWLGREWLVEPGDRFRQRLTLVAWQRVAASLVEEVAP